MDPTFSFDIRLPSEQINPNWFGAVQMQVSIPSKGVYNAYLGQAELTLLPVGQFSTLQFPVPPALVPALNGSYTDLQFSIVLNLPQGAPGTYNIDNLRVGALTTPPVALPTDTPIRRDLVGLSSTGVVHVGANGESASPALTLGAVYVEERDQACVPSAATACRYIVHLSRFRVGPFSMLSTNFAGAQIFNENPFEVVLGGSGPSSLSSPIPSNVLFAIVVEGQGKGFSAFPGSSSSITINPSGNGIIAMSGQLHTNVDGHGVDFDFSTVADSPLANRPPIANAGPDQSLTSTSVCEVAVTLNGTASSDPDGNLVTWRWLEGKTLWGTGPTLSAKLHHSGTHVLTLSAVDSFGSLSQDSVAITANLPANCH